MTPQDNSLSDSHCSERGIGPQQPHSDPAQEAPDHWGDSLEHDTSSSRLRIATININGLPKHTSHVKNGQLREALALYNIDVLGMSEINIKWDRIYPTQRLKQRISHWWEHCHCNYAYNFRDLSTAVYQPGGTALLTLHSTSHKVRSPSASDPEGLGRWTSTLYNGKQGIRFRIIQVYCPSLPSITSYNSTYAQHQRFFLTRNISDCPRTLFLTHLSRFIHSCTQAQEQVLVMGDFNHVVDSDIMTNFMNQHHLHNIHHTLHPTFHSRIPTHERGSRTIDGIFGSPGITAIRGGFASFKAFPTDHRLLWCDISHHTIFGVPKLIITPHARRRLKCEDPRVVKSFCKRYHKLLQDNHLFSSATRLKTSIQGPLTPEQITEYERIDKLRVKFMLAAEKKCRKFKVGGVEFSPKIQHQRDRISLWKHVLSKKQGGKASLSLLTRLEKRVGISNSLSYPISEIKSELTDAFSKYKSLKKPHNGSDLRDEWIESLAAAKAAANNSTLAAELLQQRQREKQRHAFRSIIWATKGTSTDFSISQVTTSVNGVTQVHSSKEEVESAIIAANDAKYRQTNDTPAMSILLPDLGFLGNTPSSQEILQGSYVPRVPIDPYMRSFISELKRPPFIPSISTTYTANDYIVGWRKMKERTSSGLSGMHFGHHKACSQSLPLAEFESAMCSIPYQTGYSPLRYKKSVNAMLKKKENKIEADKLRTILLLEADYNHLNKKLGRDLMIHAEKHHLIAPEQFGSRKNHSCIDQVLVKRLYYDSLRTLRRNGFLCSNDAKACYDRIVHSIASISMQRVGMPIEPIISMLQTLQDMTHHLKTAHGISNLTYGSSRVNNKPVQGSGQGNGASPTIWTLISSPLLFMMKKLGFGASFSTPLTQESITFAGCSFVDDTDLLLTDPEYNKPLHQVRTQMQNAIDAWSSGLRVSGGAIVPSKSWIYPIQFSFDHKGNPTYDEMENLGLNFTVKDANEQRQALSLVPANEARETLGVFLAPDGNESKQIEHLKSKVNHWSDKVRTNHISKYHASLAVSSTIYKTLEYSTPALTISAKQWTSIMSPLMKCGLHAQGMCKTLPKILRESSHQHLSLQMKCMYKVQEINKLEKYLHFRTHHGLVGQMLRLNEELLLLEVGTGGNIFDLCYKTFHRLTTDTWMKSVWKFIDSTNLHITMVSPALPHTKENDVFLTAAFIQQGYRNSQLQTLNTCRKYLQVITLGDITGADGTCILPLIKQGRRSLTSTSNYTWPFQPMPPPAAWKLWRQAIRRTFEFQGSVKAHLHSSRWASHPPRKFHWYFNTNMNYLFKRSNDSKWQLYRPCIRRGRQPRHQVYRATSTVFNSLPAGSTPTTVTPLAPHRVQIMGQAQVSVPPQQPAHQSILTYAQHQYPQLCWVLQSITGLENIEHIVQSIRRGNCAMISDGSFHPVSHQASSAWTLGNEALHRRISGHSRCVGHKTTHSAYRGELSGLYGGLFTIKILCEYFHLNEGRLIIGCDGQGALHKVQTSATLSSTHFDYVSAIQNLIRDIPLSLQFLHVKGHLDKVLDMHQMSTVEKMNMLVDIVAREYNETPYDESTMAHKSLYKEYGPIKLQDNDTSMKITSNLRTTLYDELTKHPAKEYWMRKLNIPPNTNTQIAWSSLANASTSLSSAKRAEIIKWNSDFCGTAKNLKRWGEQKHSSCPTCGVSEETTTHILKCPHPSSSRQWERSLSNLKDWMLLRKTAPDITNVIIENLRSWRDDRPPVLYNGHLPHLSEAQSLQSIIGWEPFLRGFPAKAWSSSQHCHYQHLNSKQTGQRWLTELIKKMWAISWDMWRFRNGVLHSQSTDTPTNLTFLITSSILRELNHGHRLLPPNCAYLFASDASTILKATINSKKLWLATVWSARDHYSPADTICHDRNSLVSAFVESWRKRIKS